MFQKEPSPEVTGNWFSDFDNIILAQIVSMRIVTNQVRYIAKYVLTPRSISKHD